MKVIIFGASGRTGSLLVEEALRQGHQVVAYTRTIQSIYPDHPNLKVEVGELDEVLRLRDTIRGADAVISALGGKSLTRHSFEVIEGINRIVTTMEMEGVRRFIYLSSLGANESQLFFPHFFRFLLTTLFLRIPLSDHAINEDQIEYSGLDWTIVRPGSLNDRKKTGKYVFGTDRIRIHSKPFISRADVAEFMIGLLSDRTMIQKKTWVMASSVRKT